MKTSTLLRLVGFLALGVALAPGAMVEWGGFRFDVSLVPDSPSVMVGEPLWVTFRITNPGPRAIDIGHDSPAGNQAGYHMQYHLTALASDGSPAPVGLVGWVGGSGAGRAVAMRPKGEYRIRLLVPNYVTLGHPGKFTLVAKRAPSGVNTRGEGREEISLALEARAEVEVLPADPARMGMVIATLGEKLLRIADAEAREIYTPETSLFFELGAFATIQDARTTPYLVRLYRLGLERGHRETAWRALQVLGKMKSQAALETIDAARRITPGDLPASLGAAEKEQMVAEIRRVAEQAAPAPGRGP